MPAMINNPKAVQKFRAELEVLIKDLQVQLRRTDSAMEEVAKQWKDEQFRKYHSEFTKDRDIFPHLCKEIKEFESGPLFEIQRKLERYLKR